MRGGRSVLVASAVALAVAGVGACRGDPDDGDGGAGTEMPTADETTARLATWFTAQADPNGLEFTDAEAECAAEGVVDGLGVARIERLRSKAANEVGSPGEGLDLLHEPPLTADEADVVYAAMTGCIDFAAQIAEVFTASGHPKADAECMAKRYLATDVPRDAIMSARTDPELMAEIRTALNEVESACSSA